MWLASVSASDFIGECKEGGRLATDKSGGRCYIIDIRVSHHPHSKKLTPVLGSPTYFFGYEGEAGRERSFLFHKSFYISKNHINEKVLSRALD